MLVSRVHLTDIRGKTAYQPGKFGSALIFAIVHSVIMSGSFLRICVMLPFS